MENNKGPEHTLRDSNLKATIWRNEGDKGSYHTTTLTRLYTDDKGEIRETHSLGKNDLLKGSELLRNAYNRINEIQRGQSQSRNAGDGDEREAFREKRQEKTEPQREAPSQER
jgi:hypothetical protein